MKRIERTEKEKVREEGKKLMHDTIKEFKNVGINAEFMNWTNK